MTDHVMALHRGYVAVYLPNRFRVSRAPWLNVTWVFYDERSSPLSH